MQRRPCRTAGSLRDGMHCQPDWLGRAARRVVAVGRADRRGTRSLSGQVPVDTQRRSQLADPPAAVVPMDAPDTRPCPRGDGTHLAERCLQGRHQFGASGLPWVENHVDPRRTIGRQLVGTGEDTGITADHYPAALADVGEPPRVGGALSRLSASIKLGWGMHQVAQTAQALGERAARDVLVEVELRRSGPGGRVRRPGRRRC